MRCAWLFAVAVLAPSWHATAGEPPKPYRVLSPKEIGIIVNGMNNRGDVVGFEWADDPAHPGVIEQRPFFARGKEMTYLPLLESYTATFPAAVSDDGLVVGRAGKPARFGSGVHLRNQGFVWDAKTGIHGLGVLEGDRASFASGISRDGGRISGVSVGNNRIRPCVWEREGDRWKGSPLPQAAALASQIMVISGDGNRVAGADGSVPCLWTRKGPGDWSREAIGEAGSLAPRGVNASGTVVGLVFTPDGQTHAAVWSREGGHRRIEEPQGYIRSEALAVNDAGAVVGTVDGPSGSETGPDAFVFEGGKLRLLTEGGPAFSSATAINDNGEVAGVLEQKEH